MRRRWALFAITVASPAEAHEAFGNLGTFYQSLLHPIADPSQGLVIAATAVLLARQPPDAFRAAFLTFCLAALATLALESVTPLSEPGLRAQAIVALALALLALAGFHPGIAPMVGIAVAAGPFAALPLDPGVGPRAVVQGIAGGAAGIALATLFLWGAIDWAARRISQLAGAVAASWIAAIALMAAILPS